MAELEVTVWLNGGRVSGDVQLKAASAHEALAALDDPELKELLERIEPSPGTLQLKAGVEALRATESDEQVLPEGEALEALKEALGATESLETDYMSMPAAPLSVRVAAGNEDARAAFLQRFGKGK